MKANKAINPEEEKKKEEGYEEEAPAEETKKEEPTAPPAEPPAQKAEPAPTPPPAPAPAPAGDAGTGSAPQLPAEVVQALQALGESIQGILAGQQTQAPAPAPAPAPPPPPQASKSAKPANLEPSGLKAQLDGITNSVNGVAEALKGLTERVQKMEAKPAHEGPVLREANKGINPRMGESAGNENALLDRLISEATDPAVKAWLGQQAAKAEITATLNAGPVQITRGYLPTG